MLILFDVARHVIDPNSWSSSATRKRFVDGRLCVCLLLFRMLFELSLVFWWDIDPRLKALCTLGSLHFLKGLDRHGFLRSSRWCLCTAKEHLVLPLGGVEIASAISWPCFRDLIRFDRCKSEVRMQRGFLLSYHTRFSYNAPEAHLDTIVQPESH